MHYVLGFSFTLLRNKVSENISIYDEEHEGLINDKKEGLLTIATSDLHMISSSYCDG